MWGQKKPPSSAFEKIVLQGRRKKSTHKRITGVEGEITSGENAGGQGN